MCVGQEHSQVNRAGKTKEEQAKRSVSQKTEATIAAEQEKRRAS